jgi:hypothetical protein
MTTHAKIGDATVAEKRATLRNDRATTFMAHAQAAAADEAGGRFAKQNATQVTGAAQYPRAALPEWVGADRAVEPPFGIDINAVEPVGGPPESRED